MRENLDDSLELIWGHEGGYVNRKTDRGGPTKFGVTAKTLAAARGVPKVTAEQVRNLTIDEAEAIYRKSYWGPAGGDQLPAGLDYQAFDTGVMSGPKRAVMLLQRTLGLKEDGWIGPATLKAVEQYPGGLLALIRAYSEVRMDFLRGIRGPQGFPSNGRGWTIRVTGKDPLGEWKDQPGVLGNAIAMAQRQRPKPIPRVADAKVDDAMSAKAEPGALGAYLKPDVALPLGGAAITAGGTALSSGLDPLRLALAIGVIVIVGLGAYFAFQRIRRTS
jgi:lysozyme family protein